MLHHYSSQWETFFDALLTWGIDCLVITHIKKYIKDSIITNWFIYFILRNKNLPNFAFRPWSQLALLKVINCVLEVNVQKTFQLQVSLLCMNFFEHQVKGWVSSGLQRNSTIVRKHSDQWLLLNRYCIGRFYIKCI